MKKWLCIVSLVMITTVSFAADGPTPPNGVNTFSVMQNTLTDFWSNLHPKVIGVCYWWRCAAVYCEVYPTLEMDEYEPDLVVTVYNGKGTNPWWIENTVLDKVSFPMGNELAKAMFHTGLGNGRGNAVPGGLKLYTKSVDVIGNPAQMFLSMFPEYILRSDTMPLMPYYQSSLDAVPERSGIAEDLKPQTYLPVDPIGSSALTHWGYEFPRSTTVQATSDYKASLMIAQHAADIVTNLNALHVVQGTANSCGTNCAVSNVIAEQNNAHEIWQEIYPNNKIVNIGETNLGPESQGAGDDNSGKGNYVFVLWRHYRGCVQGAHYLFSTTQVSPTVKR